MFVAYKKKVVHCSSTLEFCLQEVIIYYDNVPQTLNDPQNHRLTSKQVNASNSDRFYTFPNLASCEEYFFRMQVSKPYLSLLSNIMSARTDEGMCSDGKIQSKYMYFSVAYKLKHRTK